MSKQLEWENLQAEGSSIGIPIGSKEFDLVVSLDRSDAKITLKQIRKSSCVVHGTWQLDVPSE